MNRVILIANAFPFGTWEPYLSTEMPYLSVFDHVSVLSLSVRKDQLASPREISLDNVDVHPINFRAKPFYLLYMVHAVTDKNYYEELVQLIKTKRWTWKRFVKMCVFFARAHYEYRNSLKYLRASGVSSDEGIVLYAYRFNYQPYLAMLLRRHYPSAIIIARAHRADLYEDRNAENYLPARQITVQNCECIYAVAEHGRDYIVKTYKVDPLKVKVAHLGTEGHGRVRVNENRKPLELVSCSFVVPVKRLDLLIESLSLVTIPVNWTHLGDGPLLAAMQSEAKRLLPSNVKVSWRGHVDNESIFREYLKLPKHVFVNVSSSEGLPVSIMEAMSCGLPVIATDVGGTREIVKNDVNGTLLPSNPTPDQIAESISSYSSMKKETYLERSEQAYRTWALGFDASVCYPAFVSDVMQRIAERKTL